MSVLRDPCASENPYKCNACLVVAYIFILIAFIVLLARLIVWISPIRFKYKTPAIGILIDFLLILWVGFKCLKLYLLLNRARAVLE